MTGPLRFVLALGPRTDLARTPIVVAVAILEQATGVGLAILLGLFSEAASDHATSTVLVLSLCLAGFVMLTQGTFIAGYFTRLRLSEEIQNAVERRFIDVAGTTPTLEIHERPGRAGRAAAVRAGRHDIREGFDRVLWLTGAALVWVSSALLMASVVPILAVLPLFAVPVLLATRRADRAHGAAVERAAPRTGLAEHLFALAATAGTGRETRLFGLAGELRRRHRDQWDRAGRDVLVADLRSRVPLALAWLVFVLAYASAIVLMVRAGLTGDASLGLIIAAVAVSSQIVGQAQALLSQIFWVLESVRAARVFLDVVAEGEAERAAVVPAAPAAVPSRLERGITLEGLGFRYWNRERPSLSRVDLELPAGSVVALVGENGAGKSTLVKLLCGLYRPGEGRILVDGTDLAAFAPEQWRARITAAFQDPDHLEMTLGDSVGLGSPDHDPERILEALRTAGGHRLLDALPQGLETRLGRRSWDGKGLSGGQWQTVANARAAMRREPLLRILDEPTASLDARAEEWLFRQYAGASRLQGGVTVLVTHRLTTAQAADLVVVLDRGRVVEVGTHDELSRADGLYAELFRLQARYFV
ncbi:ABC transporter ATP-binding protein [Nonomuraea sp. NPDC049419]|uniref:ABC transporter ATP-binding protein n=1 Tax=Nonomuraea sp. NPDC049419 TaxID=3155772 RepID=UPI00341D9B99